MAVNGEEGFFQSPPTLGNTWNTDPFLRQSLAAFLPADILAEITPGLERLGHRAANEMLDCARDALAHPPRHVPYDAWGHRIDAIETSDGWRRLHDIAAEEGIVATAYLRKEGEFSRLHQFARLYLYHPSSAICSCPLAMTDGAARVIELHAATRLQYAFEHLVSLEPGKFLTSGQWMTERAGGSDVSRSETVARPDGKDFTLHGVKWFTSATTSQMAFTLARVQETSGTDEALSLFFLELRDDANRLRNIQVNRLKDKLGTRALPTAELTLQGTPAQLVGERGKGVRTIATLLNITRLYNACCAASQMRRAVMLASDYANKRIAFGKPLIEHPLHAATLRALEIETRGATLMVFALARMLGREETGTAGTDERKLLRLLTPLVKLYTAKQCVAVCSEALEAFGGAGYVEDTGLPELLRDAQVLAIWEGTTNVLALDMQRAAAKDGSLPLWLDDMRRRVGELGGSAVGTPLARRLQEFSGQLAEADPERDARQLAFAMARLLGGVLLAELANRTEQPDDDAAVQEWLRRAIVTA